MTSLRHCIDGKLQVCVIGYVCDEQWLDLTPTAKDSNYPGCLDPVNADAQHNLYINLNKILLTKSNLMNITIEKLRTMPYKFDLSGYVNAFVGFLEINNYTTLYLY